MNEGIGQLAAGRIINTGHRRASYIDLSGTLFLRQSDPVDQADDFIFIDSHGNRIVRLTSSTGPKADETGSEQTRRHRGGLGIKSLLYAIYYS